MVGKFGYYTSRYRKQEQELQNMVWQIALSWRNKQTQHNSPVAQTKIRTWSGILTYLLRYRKTFWLLYGGMAKIIDFAWHKFDISFCFFQKNTNSLISISSETTKLEFEAFRPSNFLFACFSRVTLTMTMPSHHICWFNIAVMASHWT